MSVHIDRITSYVELIQDDAERAPGAATAPSADLARQRAALERIAMLEARTRAEEFDD